MKIRRAISERTGISAGFKPAVSPAHAARCTESAVRTPARSVAARRESATRANAAVAPPAEGPRGPEGAPSTICATTRAMETSSAAAALEAPTPTTVETSASTAVTAVLGERQIWCQSQS
jgi:hypothetical protein